MHRFVPAADAAGGNPPPDPAHAAAIRRWTQAYLKLPDDAVVSVFESACADAGCPLVETVIAVFEAGRTRRWKLTRPRIAVTKTMVQQTLATPPV